MLVASGKRHEMYEMYAFMTKLITLILSVTVGFLVLYSKEVVYLISGSSSAMAWGESVFVLHMLGSTFFILNSFNYYLQNALGTYKVHLVGSIISVLIYTPILYYFLQQNGAIAAAMVWFSFNLIWFFTWGLLVHLRIDRKFFLTWILRDVMPVMVYPVVIYFSYYYFFLRMQLEVNLDKLYFGLLLYCFIMFSGLFLDSRFRGLACASLRIIFSRVIFEKK
jgi:O-antigen/teichoic acid export membrane protein